MVRKRLQAVFERIHDVCARSGRDEKEVEVVLVTKQIALEQIEVAYEDGIRDFGDGEGRRLGYTP